MADPNEGIVDASAAPVLEVVASTTPVASVPAPVAQEAAAPAQPDQAAPAQSAPAETVPPAAGAEPPAHEHAPTLLDKAEEKAAAKDKPAVEAKPDEPKPEAEAEKPADEKDKPAAEVKEPDAAPVAEIEAAPESTALVPIDYFAAEGGIKLPETLVLDDAGKQEVTAAFDAFRADPKAGMQGLFDLHAKYLQQAAAHTVDEQWRAFNETNEGWAKVVMADPVLGGAGHDTAMARIGHVRDAIASKEPRGSEKWQAEVDAVRTAMRVTGAGNNPAILRMLYNMGDFIREARLPPTDGKPPKGNGAAPRTKGKLVYDNPTSPQTTS